MKKIFPITVCVAFLVTGCQFFGKTVSDDPVFPTNEAAATMEAMQEPEEQNITQNVSANEHGAYADYDESAVQSALADGKKVVLFFHAPWCPTCKIANDNFIKEIPPADLAVFKVDYDSSLELKKKYGVTYQHTFIALNADGTLKKKSSGEKTYDALEELF